jgi:hypothetical protein
MSYGMVALALVLGCTDKKDNNPSESTETLDGVTVEANPNNPMSAFVVLTPSESLEDVTVVYGAGEDFDFETPHQSIEAGVETRILVLGLEHDTDCRFRLEGTKADGTPVESEELELRSGDLFDGFPVPTIMDRSADFPGGEAVCTNVTVEDHGDIYCMDRQGRPRWVLHHPDDGKISTIRPLRNGTIAGVSMQDVTVFDASGAVVNTFSLRDQVETRYVHALLDPREVIEITEGPWDGDLAILTMTIEVLGDGSKVEGHGIVVYDPETNAVDWDWSVHGPLGDDESIDPAMLDYKRVGLSVNFEDWDHNNALLHGIDPNGDQFFWTSMRHQDWIVKISCEDDKIAWRFGRDGDFVLQDEDGIPYEDDGWYMYQQHAPEWQSHGDGVYDFIVYDNGESRMTATGLYEGPKYSRILRFVLDENTMSARKVWDYGSPDLSDPSHFYANDHGANIMMPGGDSMMFVRQGDDGPFVSEISYPDGEILWRATYADGEQQLYRIDFWPSYYDTAWWYGVDR